MMSVSIHSINYHGVLDVPDTTYRLDRSDTIRDDEWDTFLRQLDNGHHVQTSLWAELKQTFGWQLLRIIMRDNQDKVVGGVQILLKQLPFIGKVGYASNGPVFMDVPPQSQANFIHQLKQIFQQESIQLCFIHPPHGNDSLIPILDKAGFCVSRQRISPTATVVFDLSLETDEIMRRMNKTARRNIRSSLKRGITVREGTAEDLPLFYKFLRKQCERHGYAPYPLDYYRKMYTLFKPGDHIQLMIAECEGRVLYIALLVSFANSVLCKKGIWCGEKTKLAPTEATDWAIIQWAKEQGYSYYDLEGIDRHIAEAVLENDEIPDFVKRSSAMQKLKYRNELRLLSYTYTYIPNPILSWAYNTVYSKIADSKWVYALVTQIQKRR